MAQTHLQTYFTIYLITPLLVAIIGTIIFNVVFIFAFIKNISKDDFFVSIVAKRDSQVTEPILLGLQSYLSTYIESSINALTTINDYYSYLSSETMLNYHDTASMNAFTNKYTLNANALSSPDKYEEITKAPDFTVFKYGIWFSTPESTTPNVDSPLQKEIYLLSNWNLLFQTYSQDKDMLSNQFAQFQIFSVSHNLIYYYPFNSNATFYNQFTTKSKSYPKWCVDSELKQPNYYYYKCEINYINAIQYKEKYNMNITVNSLGNNEMSICLNKIQSNNIIICINTKAEKLWLHLQHINSLLSGYFFLIKSNFNAPWYYPSINTYNNYSNSFIQYEYDLNSTFYLDEIANNNDLLSTIIQQNQSIVTGEYYKKGMTVVYEKYPINIERNGEVQNIISLVYIHDKVMYANKIEYFQDILIPSFIFQILFFVILGFIIILTTRYLIINISMKITNPMKLVSQTLQGLTISTNMAKDKNYNEIEKEEEENEQLSWLNIVHGSNKENDLIELEEKKYQFEELPKEINNLLQQWITLKQLCKTTAINYNEFNLLNIIFSKSEFKKSQNWIGERWCESNLGNLSIKERKYDKAIFHLMKSINSTSLLTDNKDLTPISRSFVESRYPKLLYAYKKYFHSLRKISANDKNELFKSDYYTMKLHHSLPSYKEILLKYINEWSTCSTQQERIKFIEAKLEWLHFTIKYELYVANEAGLRNKISEINENINELKQIIDERIGRELTDENIKNIVDWIRTNKKTILDGIDTPIYILHQKLNYWIGIFCLHCCQYPLALKYFYKSKTNGDLPWLDAKIIRKSKKHILNIISKANDISDNPLLFWYLNSWKVPTNSSQPTIKRDIAIWINAIGWDKSVDCVQLVSQSKVVALNIYDNIVTSEDTFGVFLSTNLNALEIEVSLSEKKISDLDYIKDQIERCFDVNTIKNCNDDSLNLKKWRSKTAQTACSSI